MEQRDYLMKEIEVTGKVLARLVATLLGLDKGWRSILGIEIVNESLKSEADLDFDVVLSVVPEDLVGYLTECKDFSDDNLEKFAEILFIIANDMEDENPERFAYYEKCLFIYNYLNEIQTFYSFDRHLKVDLINAVLMK